MKGLKTAGDLWEQVFSYKRAKYPNICAIAEIVLCVGASNSVVEKGFSQLSSMLSDRRLNLGADTMEILRLKSVTR